MLFFEVGDMDKIVYTTLNDTSGSFIQAIINYRQKMNFELQNDKIFSVAINQEKLKKWISFTYYLDYLWRMSIVKLDDSYNKTMKLDEFESFLLNL
mgnify:CR=1 FL=1